MQEKLHHSLSENRRVIAFVGPAGTGKSQRAQMISRENNVDFMIDDGLLISKGRIVAGKSAKAEKNLVRAIRRALFQFPDHRSAVLDYLSAPRAVQNHDHRHVSYHGGKDYPCPGASCS